MTALADLELPSFDYLDPELRGERFHSAMAELAEQGWLATMPLGCVAVDREAGEFFLRSRSFTFPGMKIAEIFGIDDGPLYEEIRRNILHINGADHRRLRGLVNPFFTPRAVEKWRPHMRGFLQQLFADLRGAKACDAVEAFCKPYPSQVIATVMGAPLADAGLLWDWSRWIQRQFGMNVVAERPQIEAAVVDFYAYAGELLGRRRAEPGDDLISALIAVEQEGDRLSDVETLNLVLNVLVGGVDTSQSQLAHGMRLFAEHPDQWALLGERPELAPQAVEEIVRYEPIVPINGRIMREDVVYRDVTFPKDTVVMIAAFSANRDGEGMAAPEEFDITAQREPHKSLTFGAGPHYCLGANLAKAELEEALAFLAPRMPGLRLDGEPVFGSINGVYGLDVLPVAWGSSIGGNGAP